MRASSTNINKSISAIVNFIIFKVCSDFNCSADYAFNSFMRTTTYTVLNDKSSKLFSESPMYVYDMLLSEFKNDINSWLEI